MYNFIAVVLQGYIFLQICCIKCEISIPVFANKSVTTTEKQNKLQQITTVYRSRSRTVFVFHCERIESFKSLNILML